MSVLDEITIDMTVVLGSTHVQIRQLLRMSRGATIALDCGHDDPTLLYVNGKLVARGQIHVHEDQMSLEVTEVVPRSLA